jgi:hypothetical protein
MPNQDFMNVERVRGPVQNRVIDHLTYVSEAGSIVDIDVGHPFFTLREK